MISVISSAASSVSSTGSSARKFVSLACVSLLMSILSSLSVLQTVLRSDLLYRWPETADGQAQRFLRSVLLLSMATARTLGRAQSSSDEFLRIFAPVDNVNLFAAQFVDDDVYAVAVLTNTCAQSVHVFVFGVNSDFCFCCLLLWQCS